MVREKHSGLLPLGVLEFSNPMPFIVVSAPATVLPAPEESAPDVVIVLRANVQTRKRLEPIPASPANVTASPSNTKPLPESSGTNKTSPVPTSPSPAHPHPH